MAVQARDEILNKWLTKTSNKGRAVKPIKESRVTVAVRVRPVLDDTRGCPDGDGGMAKIALTGNSSLNTVESDDGKRGKDYPFDYVFTNDQFEIYDCIGKDMLAEAFAGYNVCLFAYGQTGSGKTYTVQGLPGAGLPQDLPHTPQQEGVLPRVIRDLFAIVEEMLEADSSLNIVIKMSIVEVYNEKVRDLLPANPTPRGQEPPSLEIVQGGPGQEGRIIVMGLTQHTVIGVDRVLQLIGQANRNRQVAETKMNECSSRSHTITQLHVVQRYENPTIDNQDCSSLISVVDLAGSERQSKTEAKGAEFTQAKYINHSLLQLGRALNSFSGKGRDQHVPLRDSKLTRLLSESFGGNSKTWMLATVAPSLYNWSESLSTLNYASNAKFITNNARQNRLQRTMEMKELKEQNSQLESSLDEMKRKNEALQRQIDAMRADNAQLRAGVDPAQLSETRAQVTEELENLQSQDVLNSARADYQHRLDTWMKEAHAPLNKTYVGRAKVSLKNIIDQSSKFFDLPLLSEHHTVEPTPSLKVKIYPVDARGAPVRETPRKGNSNSPPDSERGLLGQRVDFVVHIISASNIPEEFSNCVYCKYVYKWAEKDFYKTNDMKGPSPEFDFRKRFAFSKMNSGLVEYFRSDNVITFEVIGV